MPVGRYVLVSTDPTDKMIKAGPVLWDGAAELAIPAGQRIIAESVSASAGYTYPPPPVTETNAATLRDRATQALTVNAAYLAIPAPTNAQVVTQIARLTRQASGLTRLLLDQTDDTAGT